MVTEKNNDRIKYIYTLKDGISNVKGGIDILTEMNYPKEIIHNTKNNK
jgi:DNA mismatch repair ATPase MutS